MTKLFPKVEYIQIEITIFRSPTVALKNTHIKLISHMTKLFPSQRYSNGCNNNFQSPTGLASCHMDTQ